TLERALKPGRDKPTILGHLGYVYARAGKRTEAAQILADLETLSAKRYVPRRLRAMVYAALGKNNEAFHWLCKGRDEMDIWLVFLKVDRTSEKLQDGPRLADLLYSMNLADKPAERDRAFIQSPSCRS